MKNPPMIPYTLPPIAEARSVYMELTPAIARSMLARNTHPRQRPCDARTATSWRERIESGHVPVTHQGIAFGADGHLYDGQHRLTGLSECAEKTKVKMLVTFNLPPESFEVLDQGRGRTVSQNLGVDPQLVAVARVFAAIVRRESSGLTPQVLKPYIEAVRPFYYELVDRCAHKGKYWHGAMPRAAAIAWLMASDQRDHAYIVDQYAALNTKSFMEMSRVVMAAYKAHDDKRMGRAASSEMFAKMTRVFDPQNRDSSNLQTPKNPSLYVEWVTELLKKRGVKV